MLNRLQAAKFLGVSTRTVDRYVAAEKFSVTRENGKVLFPKSELENFKNSKNPVVAQVVRNTAIAKKPNTIGGEEEIKKYKILYQEAKDDVQKRDDLIRKMHYKLGRLETEKKQMVPMLEAQNTQKEIEEVVDKISIENIQLQSQLKKAKYGRAFFFTVAFLFLFALAAVFATGVEI